MFMPPPPPSLRAIALFFSSALSAASADVIVQSMDEQLPSTVLSVPRIRIQNTSNQALEGVRIEYDYSATDCGTVDPYYVPYIVVTKQGDSNTGCKVVLELTRSLPAGGWFPDDAGWSFGLHYPNWIAWNKTDDLSWNATSSMQSNLNISAWVGAQQIWGNARLQSLKIALQALMPRPNSGQSPWVEIQNDDVKELDLSGVELGVSAVTTIEFPAQTYLAAGRSLRVQFDGGENVLMNSVYHAPIATTLDGNEGGQAWLRRNSTLISYVAWGEPFASAEDSQAVAAGIWPKFLASLILSNDRVGQLPFLGTGSILHRQANLSGKSPEHWVISKTEGYKQLPSGVIAQSQPVMPMSGLRMYREPGESDSLSFSWVRAPQASQYKLIISADARLGSPIVDTLISDNNVKVKLGAGAYFWGTFALSNGDGAGLSGNLPIGAAEVLTIGAADPTKYTNVQKLNVFPLAARKDTRLLDVNWGPMFAQKGWDRSHVGDANLDEESDNRCWAVATQMLNRYYGGSLTQDEIKIHTMNLSPEDNFTHIDAEEVAYPDEIQKAIQFAFQLQQLPIWNTNPLTETIIRDHLVKHKPLYISIPGHAMVLSGITGISTDEAGVLIDVLNTDNNGKIGHWLFDPNIILRWLALDPALITPRMQDPRVYTDTDLDGVMDFDEEERFNTLKDNSDSDGDGVPDKQDILIYASRNASWATANGAFADIDSDGKRAELDSDSDGGGLSDGDEDLNRNGLKDGNEKDPLDASDDSKENPSSSSFFNQYALYGFDQVKVNDGVVCNNGTAFCNIAAAGSILFPKTVELGRSAEVGSILSSSGVFLRNMAKVHGSVKSGASIEKQIGVVVDGMESANASISSTELPTYLTLPALSLTGTESNKDISNLQEIALNPGLYGTVTVRDGATLVLTAGTYEFKDFYVAWTAKIKLDQTAGPVKIRVQKSLLWNGPMVQGISPESVATRFMLVYYGTDHQFLLQNFAGCVVMPYVTLSLAQTSRNFFGMAIARQIEVHQYAVVKQIPFTHGF